MKDIIISSSDYNHITHMIDEAEISARYGNQVFFLLCNSYLGYCGCNTNGNTFKCFRCVRYTKRLLKKCSQNIHVIELDQKIMDDIRIEVDKVKYVYHSIDDIKSLEYKGAKVGYGCLSAYITATRNINFLIDDVFRDYFDKLLKTGCYFAEFQLRMIDDIQPDRIQLFNGRFFETRAAVDFALQRHILLKCCEQQRILTNTFHKIFFHNAMPHDISANTKIINQTWEKENMSLEEKERYGQWFFESKQNHTYCGDIDYTILQENEKLPDNWDYSKKNYVIFNSSEDENICISEEYDKGKVFKTQYEGISYIADLLKDRNDIIIYLRIHPNLRNVKYKYHTDLLGLGGKYHNLFVIPADSDVSTYALMHKANKVITFGSTAGIEASYMGKPVIALSRNSHSGLDMCYEAVHVEEARQLLLSDDLKPKPQLESIKYGFFQMNPHLPKYSFFDFNYHDITFLGRQIRCYNLAKYLGSTTLYALVGWGIGHFFTKDTLPDKEDFR